MLNTEFWLDPPWIGATGKHRLGLRPIEQSDWLRWPPGDDLLDHKRRILTHRYDDAVFAAAGTGDAQKLLLDLPVAAEIESIYPHTIANVAAQMAEDLCLLDIEDRHRLIAACVCSPSYWRLTEKAGLPLTGVHGPVPGLEQKLGGRITEFIDRVSLSRPFERRNWFMHGDTHRFHLAAETSLPQAVADWFVRVERQTLCKLSPRYLLFTIDVLCEPLVHITQFPQARVDLARSLRGMDADEIEHFGGLDKFGRLLEYLQSVPD